MIGLLALVLALAQAPTKPVVRGTVVDAATGAAIPAAQLRTSRAHARTDEHGEFAIDFAAGDTIRIRRVGYRPALAVPSAGDTAGLRLQLTPLALRLGDVRVVAGGDGRVAGVATAGRSLARVEVADARERGAASTADLLAALPYVTARSSRAGLALSMRGSRPEQVLVLLDGVPLNDPATGAADISDIPLAALGAVTAIPGAAGAALGSGASGGVVALSGDAPASISLHTGAFGRLGLGGSGSARLGAVALRGGAEYGRAENDFPFVNSAGVRDTLERRVNADEERIGLFGAATASAVQLTVLASRSERGLAGPMNVRLFDRARGTTRRGMARLVTGLRGWNVATAARVLEYEYRGSGAPSRTRSVSGELGVDRALGGWSLRAGGGADRVRAPGLADSVRPRAYASVERGAARRRWRGSAALRGDAIRDGGAHLSPSVGAEWSGPVTVRARVGQAFRAPTFYDLYFASPLRVDVTRRLASERVVLDAELGAAWTHRALAVSGAVFERRTRDAIVWFPGTFDWSPRNVGTERVRGAELRAGVALERRTVGASLDAWGAVRSTALRVDRDGVEVPTPYVPGADGGAVLRVRRAPFSFAATLSVVGSRPSESIPDPPPSLVLPAAAQLDVHLAYTAALRGVSVTFGAGARNLTDERWESVARYPAPGRSWLATLTLTP